MNPKIEKSLDYLDKIENLIDKLSYESSYPDDFIEDIGLSISDLRDKLESAEDQEGVDSEDSDEE